MKKYFREKFSDAYYDFVQDTDIPKNELVTCVFALLHLKGKIYLTKNQRGWELPGGHIEKGENFDEALNREMREEVGIKTKNNRIFGYKKYTNLKRIANREGGFYPFPHSYILFYIGEPTGKSCKKYCPDTLDYGLFDVEEALKKVKSQGTKKIITIMKEFI